MKTSKESLYLSSYILYNRADGLKVPLGKMNDAIFLENKEKKEVSRTYFDIMMLEWSNTVISSL